LPGITEPSFSMRACLPFLRVADGHARLSKDKIETLRSLDPDARIPTHVALELLETAVAKTGDPDLGLRAALEIGPGDYDLVEFVAASSATYREAITSLGRFAPLLNDGLTLSLEQRPGHALMRVSCSVPLGRTAMDFVVGGFYLGFVRREPTGVDPVREVWLRHPEPDDTSTYASVFGRRVVRFACPFDGLLFDERLLDLATPGADPRLHELLRRLAEEQLAERPVGQAFSDEVRSVVVRELRGGDVTVGDVADELGMSRRTLARRLEQEGTTYKAVADDVRRELAERYLVLDDLRMGEVAALLGFSDSAAFHRAFRRWYGTTPGEYRRRHGIGRPERAKSPAPSVADV